MNDWKTLSSRIVHETKWLRLIEDTVIIHTGKELTYTYVQMARPGVAIVAVDPDGRIFLEKCYRHTLKTTQWELPAGHMEDGETPLETARRELLEEASLASDSWSDLGQIELAAGIGDVKMHLFVARQVCTVSDNHKDEDEAISEQQFVTIEELKRMLQAHEISSASSLVGLYRYLATIDMKENI